MISAWWLIPAMMVGAIIGIFIIAVCNGTWKDDN